MSQQEPLRAKRWTSDHLILADAAERVRTRLRRMLPKLPLEVRSEVACCANVLTWAMKARESTPIPRARKGAHNDAVRQQGV